MGMAANGLPRRAARGRGLTARCARVLIACTLALATLVPPTAARAAAGDPAAAAGPVAASGAADAPGEPAGAVPSGNGGEPAGEASEPDGEAPAAPAAAKKSAAPGGAAFFDTKPITARDRRG